ncbi:hypothetical protein HG530_001786 [Fusarium avenaceum]|nr:hypothetical protein HG530_001786 [Fusarium avenaceum]
MKVFSSSMPATDPVVQVVAEPQLVPPPVGQPVSEIMFFCLSVFHMSPFLFFQKLKLRRPVITQIRSGNRQFETLLVELGAGVVQNRSQRSNVHLLAEQNLVGDNNSFEWLITIFVKNIPHLVHLSVVGRLVLVQPNTQPNLGIVGSVQSNLVGQLTQDGNIASDVVLGGWVVHAIGVLRVERSVVHARENSVQVRVVKKLLDLCAVLVEIAVLLLVVLS